MAKRLQQAMMARLGLKTPLIFAADVIHGHRTIFPVPVAEAASFDAELARRTALAAARARGFQSSSLNVDDAVMACVKHSAPYGRAEAGLDYNIVDVFDRMLREVYLPPCRA